MTLKVTALVVLNITGSAAESSGLKEGQIVVTINGVNVLDASHDEIIKLVTRGEWFLYSFLPRNST